MQEKKRKKLANTNKSHTTKHTNENKGYQHRNKIRQYSKKYMSLSRQLHLVLLVFAKCNLNRSFLKYFSFGLVRIERGVSITVGQNVRTLI